MDAPLRLGEDGAERLDYIAAGFPLRFVRSSLSVFPEYAAACHWHRDYEFLLAEKGDIDYFVNGRIVHVGEGQAIFVNSNRLHYGFSTRRQECAFSVLVFHPALLGAPPLPTAAYTAALSADGQRDCLLLDGAEETGARALAAFRRIGELCEQRPALYEFAVQSACCELIALLYGVMRPSDGGEALDPAWQILRGMTGYLQANYTRPVRLAEIAAAGAVCRSKCCALFRERLGQTPMEYLMQYRLEKALGLLQTTRLSVTEIAHRTGFDGASYLAERFRERYGASPREYRAQVARDRLTASAPARP